MEGRKRNGINKGALFRLLHVSLSSFAWRRWYEAGYSSRNVPFVYFDLEIMLHLRLIHDSLCMDGHLNEREESNKKSRKDTYHPRASTCGVSDKNILCIYLNSLLVKSVMNELLLPRYAR